MGGGSQTLTFFVPRRFPVNTAVVLTLAAGGAGILGTVYGQAWPE